MALHRLIDTHQHVVPDFWREELEAHGGDPSGWTTPIWTDEKAITFMDSMGIETAILSVTAPGVNGWKGQEKLDMARRLNEFVQTLVVKQPQRFGNFLTPPLPDVDGALAEIAYGLDVLKVDGVVLLSNYEGKYLGDALFEPIWAELNRRKAVAFIHPAANEQLPLIPKILGSVVDYPFDTTRTAVHLVRSGIMRRYTDVKIILSHAGGMLPYVAYRIAMRQDEEVMKEEIADMKRFYFDLALSSSVTALPCLLALVGPDHITYGSDFCYAPVEKSRFFVRTLREYGIDETSARQIARGTATTLFPRLAAYK